MPNSSSTISFNVPRQVPPHAVPAMTVKVFAEKVSEYACVIPVLNEGDRIRNQLMRMTELNLPVDIIIADGGSTDGVVDNDAFIREMDVKAIVTKIDEGRQSAQLRCAFNYALSQGYKGIITVDGNGKDGVEAIPDFVEKLEEGYVFVQGSRYIEGGIAENTPADRAFAVKYIHSPLISLGALHRYTDTTNGFRAYSRALLESKSGNVFRDGFSQYELLFHSSVVAPRIGKVCEVPVRRSYPDNGEVPTKISGLSGKISIMIQLLKAITGYTRLVK